MPAEAWLYLALFLLLGMLLTLLIVLTRLLRQPGTSRAAPPPTASAPAGQTPAPAPAASAPAFLHGLAGPYKGQRIELPPNGLNLGRSPDNQCVLADEPLVSRRHAEIRQQDGAWFLNDCDSSNGSWVNGQRIGRCALAVGDHIQLGATEWLFSNQVTPPPPAPPPAPPEPPPASGIRLSGAVQFEGYWLEQQVGQGGMSRVFKAHAADGCVVAIKLLQSADPYLVQKFEAEGNEIGPRLRNHPHIASIHSFKRSADGQLYLVMDFVDGVSLRQRLGQGALAEQEIVQIMAQTCDALGFAHAASIVHRDVKPENILLAAGHDVKVVDFGIARLTSAVNVTQNKLVGTPEYMSPEQAKGEPVKAPSDVYSLGIVLYELLTGRVPFPLPPNGRDWNAAMTVVDQHIRATPVPPRQRVATVAADLEQVALKALAKQSRQRFADGSQMGQALLAMRRSQPDVTPLPAPFVRLTVLSGPAAGRQWQIGASLTLGRLDFDPNDTQISRAHAHIHVQPDGVWLEDVSTNGTWLNQAPLHHARAALCPGDLIAIGAHVLRIEF